MEKNHTIEIRKAKLDDIQGILEVEEKAWPPGGAATRGMIESRILTFSDGVWIALDCEKIVGVVCFEIINIDNNNPSISSWYTTTDNGLITKSHVFNGNAIFGIDLSVVPDAPYGVGTKLLIRVGQEAIKRNFKYCLLGGRIPGYHHYSDRYTPDEYLKLKNELGEPLDSEIRFYQRAGLKIGRVIPNYFNDAESHNFGVLIIWRNPFYMRYNFFGLLVGKILNKLVVFL